MGKLVLQIFSSVDDFKTGVSIKAPDLLGIIRFARLYFKSVRTRELCPPGMFHFLSESLFIPFYYLIGFLSLLLPLQTSDPLLTSSDF